MKEKIKMLIKSAESISLCADFWTGKDGIGYLGVTASLLVEDERQNLMICLQHVEHPHTGQVDSKLSDAIPAFLSLLVELDDHSEKFPDFVATLKHDLIKRTRCIFDPTFVSFNSIFAMSTYLDPSN